MTKAPTTPAETESQPKVGGKWNYHPELPLANRSVFSWPPEPGFLARWFWTNWLTLSERMMLVIISFAAWYFLYPSLEASKILAIGWIVQTWAVNMGLMIAAAGGLHWYFYMKRGQGKKLKFDARDQARDSRTFKFKNQVHDNMFWSLASGVTVWTAFQVLVIWGMANGYAPTIALADHPVWSVVLFVVLPMWSAFHFYWVHRLLHVSFMYKRFHALHHRNVNIGPWSGMSMHPVEQFLYSSTVLIHFLIPSHPVHLIFHLVFQGPGAAMSHTGYEDLLIKDKRRLALGTFYHTLHHRFFECNYGNQELPMDRWFGTFHDGTEERMHEIRARKNAMHG
jgi:sterol desaturase/sphingolipid hydroxylase (fatty acid hydroxylase superfamily)